MRWRRTPSPEGEAPLSSEKQFLPRKKQAAKALGTYGVEQALSTRPPVNHGRIEHYRPEPELVLRVPPYVEKYQLTRLAKQLKEASPAMVKKSLSLFQTHFLYCLSFTESGRLEELNDCAPGASGFVPRFRVVTSPTGRQVHDEEGNLIRGVLERTSIEVPGVGLQRWNTENLQAWDINIQHLGVHIDDLPKFELSSENIEFWRKACEHFYPAEES